ncbi:DUF222 domain-containing protein [Nocardioides sp. DS6]|uniref:DUF222 domain-containing protein n=1 Tax=Nocardioides eburneus TaxID=3231482 RepID=A0ABV3SSU4_9ACTN
MSQPSLHPIRGCVASIEAALDEVSGVDPMFLATAEKETALRELARAEARLAALRLRVMASADDVAASAGARDAGAWWADAVHADIRAARADLRLARALERRPALDAALRDGRVPVEHTRVIARALEILPPELTDEQRAKAEQILLDEATRLTPTQLRRVGDHLLEILDPQATDDALGRRLQAEEDRAHRRTWLTLTDPGDGTVHLKGRIPKVAGARLRTYLEAFTQPRLAALEDRGQRVPYDRLLGQAFCQLLERYDPDQLPRHGGDATTLVITMPHDQLTRELGVATLPDGTPVTAAAARRLACAAGLLPAVLGAQGEVLDLGRQIRLFTPVQRKALRIRHRTCAAEGCTIAATWTEAHHLRPWAAGGRSDLSNAVLLCGHHHRLAHHPGYDLRRLASGELRFHRRT